MTNKLNASKTSTEVAEGMLSVLRCVTDEHSAVYCSAPITSGRRSLDWSDRNGYSLSTVDDVPAEMRGMFAQEVIEPNIAHARAFASQLRTRTNEIIIDPTAVRGLTNWTQRDWLTFWEDVIVHYAHRVVFLNDWQFSNGCSHEFLVAQRNQIPSLDEWGNVIGLEEGRRLIENAVREFESRGRSAKHLHDVLRSLHLLASRELPSGSDR